MFPIRDHNPSGRTPYVVYALMLINVIAFVLLLPLYDDPARLWAVYGAWGVIPSEPSALNYLTAMFLHGGVMHLAGNMLFLWIFGDNLEDEMGHLGFLVFYLFSGLLATAIHVASDPGSTVPLVGASGAIAGVMGGYLLLFPRARVDVFIIIYGIFPVRAWLMLLIWFTFQVINGATADISSGGVAYWAHAGGFVIGVLFAVPLWLRLGGARYWTETDGHPPHPDAQYARSSVPMVRRR